MTQQDPEDCAACVFLGQRHGTGFLAQSGFVRVDPHKGKRSPTLVEVC